MDIKNGVGPSKVFVKNTEKTHTYLIDFLVEKLRSKQYKMGIGNFKIGINLQIDKPESTDSREITDVFI